MEHQVGDVVPMDVPGFKATLQEDGKWLVELDEETE